jgi:hypothetical protein
MSNTYYVVQKKAKRYGFFHFCLDVVLTCVTSGLWLIWIFVREMRKAR